MCMFWVCVYTQVCPNLECHKTGIFPDCEWLESLRPYLMVVHVHSRAGQKTREAKCSPLAHCMPVPFFAILWNTEEVTEKSGKALDVPQARQTCFWHQELVLCLWYCLCLCVHAASLSLLALWQNDGALVFLDLVLSFVFFYGVFFLLHKMICSQKEKS